jgi:hypothetical protein
MKPLSEVIQMQMDATPSDTPMNKGKLLGLMIARDLSVERENEQKAIRRRKIERQKRCSNCGRFAKTKCKACGTFE